MTFELNEETAEQLRHLLAHPAWQHFFKAHLEQWRQSAIESLLDPTEERRKTYSDDYLRAQVAILTSLQRIGQAELATWDAGTAQEAERQRQEAAYDEAAQLGVYRPQQ